MNPKTPLDWETISSRVTLETTPIHEPPPFGLASRMVARWREQQREAWMQRWGWWSLRAALTSACACVVVVLMHDQPQPEPKLLLEPPSSDWIHLPLTPP